MVVGKEAVLYKQQWAPPSGATVILPLGESTGSEGTWASPDFCLNLFVWSPHSAPVVWYTRKNWSSADVLPPGRATYINDFCGELTFLKKTPSSWFSGWHLIGWQGRPRRVGTRQGEGVSSPPLSLGSLLPQRFNSLFNLDRARRRFPVWSVTCKLLVPKIALERFHHPVIESSHRPVQWLLSCLFREIFLLKGNTLLQVVS